MKAAGKYQWFWLCAILVWPPDMVWRIPLDPLSAGVDMQGNNYVVDKSLNLIKLEKNGNFVKRISVANFGHDPVVDASNPLEVFLFYASLGKAVWFDNQLNQRGETDLFAAGIVTPAAFGRANDGAIWVVDANSQTLKKINRNGELLEESMLISGFSMGRATNPVTDNGESVIMHNGINIQYAWNTNLQYLGNRNTGGPLVARKGSSCLYQTSDGLVRCNCLSGKSDTVLFTSPKGRLLASDWESVLAEDGSTLVKYKIQ